MTRGMGIDTPMVYLFEQTMRLLNRVPIGRREIRVDGECLFPDTMDRFLAALGWKFGWVGGPEAAFIRRVVQRGMVVADVGANIGLHTLALARRVGSTGRVHAIEPEPNNFRALRHAVEVSGYDHVELHCAAAAAESGQMSLYVSHANRGDHRGIPVGLFARDAITVEKITLDSVFADETSVDFVKIDVQGAEGFVLQGMQEVLRRNPQIIVVCEICPFLLAENRVSFSEFFAPVVRAGLQTHVLSPTGELVEIPAEAAWSQAERDGYLDIILRKNP